MLLGRTAQQNIPVVKVAEKVEEGLEGLDELFGGRKTKKSNDFCVCEIFYV